MSAPVYDLVLEGGIHKVGVRLGPEGPTAGHEGRAVLHALPVRGLYRWPYLGTMLRNFWAKRKGALLYDPPPSAR